VKLTIYIHRYTRLNVTQHFQGTPVSRKYRQVKWISESAIKLGVLITQAAPLIGAVGRCSDAHDDALHRWTYESTSRSLGTRRI
jgi:hypothetical protein